MKATGQPGHSASRCSSSRCRSHSLSRSRSTHNSIEIPRRRLYVTECCQLICICQSPKIKVKIVQFCALLIFYFELFSPLLPLLLTFTQKACSHGWRMREGGKGNIFEHCTLIMRRKEKKQKSESFEMRNVDESRLSCFCS